MARKRLTLNNGDIDEVVEGLAVILAGGLPEDVTDAHIQEAQEIAEEALSQTGGFDPSILEGIDEVE